MAERSEAKSAKRSFGRSFLEQVVGGVVGATLVVGSASATHGRLTQAAATDSDSGAQADPVGRGRGGRTGGPQGQAGSGVTDRDGGPTADPAGQGRSGGSASRPSPAIEAENARIRAENRRVEEENRRIQAMERERDQLETEMQALGGSKPPQKL
ncbi:hypothetical protein [uncultured Maricaulis sp.]|uniref:hypothetical protein n=1 Tax=uncultured Maricaulis sp. TaxID=174710 RepID=UPI0030D96E91